MVLVLDFFTAVSYWLFYMHVRCQVWQECCERILICNYSSVPRLWRLNQIATIMRAWMNDHIQQNVDVITYSCPNLKYTMLVKCSQSAILYAFQKYICYSSEKNNEKFTLGYIFAGLIDDKSALLKRMLIRQASSAQRQGMTTQSNDSCQLSERYDHYNIKSRGFETSPDLAVELLTAYWLESLQQYCITSSRGHTIGFSLEYMHCILPIIRYICLGKWDSVCVPWCSCYTSLYALPPGAFVPAWSKHVVGPVAAFHCPWFLSSYTLTKIP